MAMVALALQITEQAHRGELYTESQKEAAATYSIWRDTFDYFIDWRRDAQQIIRQINFVGYPYEGARAVLRDRILSIVKAQLGPDIPFVIRDPGKLWKIDGRRALVVCGRGTLWIDEAVDANKMPFTFKHLRGRFLTADTAWIAPFASHQ
jgi:methionyl-tRNA formyltransferase